MHIASMNIENVPPFTTSVKLSLDRHVNVLIGPNASGKTTILRNLISRLPEPPNFGFELSDDWPSRDWQRIVRNRLRFPATGVRTRVGAGVPTRVRRRSAKPQTTFLGFICQPIATNYRQVMTVKQCATCRLLHGTGPQACIMRLPPLTWSIF